MLTYEPDDSLAHRLDPRTKLLLQIAFVVAAFAHPTPDRLAALTVLAIGCLAGARVDLRRALWSVRYAVPFLVAGPLLAALTIGSPWFVPADAFQPALASYRVLLVLLVSAAYVRSTPVRASRAAIQRTVPGRPGAFLGIGVALVFRFLPLLRRDILAVRAAMAVRLAENRPVTDRIRLLVVAALGRAFGRADRLSLALRARCFAWNPTLPELRFTRLDAPVLLLSVGLLMSAIL